MTENVCSLFSEPKWFQNLGRFLFFWDEFSEVLGARAGVTFWCGMWRNLGGPGRAISDTYGREFHDHLRLAVACKPARQHVHAPLSVRVAFFNVCLVCCEQMHVVFLLARLSTLPFLVKGRKPNYACFSSLT